MRCEIVAIGTELLLGQIVDTNSSWIGEQLALNGIDSHFQTKVGDNFNQPARGDLVVMTLRKTRWERFVNLILLPWRYIWTGRFKL